MTDVEIAGDFDSLMPPWYKALVKAIREAAADGWKPTAPIVMEGEPYVFNGEPRMSRWTLGATEN